MVGDNFYKIFPPSRYYDAEKTCSGNGGQLAVANTHEKMRELKEFVRGKS